MKEYIILFRGPSGRTLVANLEYSFDSAYNWIIEKVGRNAEGGWGVVGYAPTVYIICNNVKLWKTDYRNLIIKFRQELY